MILVGVITAVPSAFVSWAAYRQARKAAKAAKVAAAVAQRLAEIRAENVLQENEKRKKRNRDDR